MTLRAAPEESSGGDLTPGGDPATAARIRVQLAR
jgi:hypothetical protein